MSFTAKTYSCGPLGKVRKLLNLNHGNWVNVPVPQAVTANADLVDIATAPNDGDYVFTVGNGAPTGFYGIAVSTNGGTTWNVPGGSYVATVQDNLNNGVLFNWNKIVVVGPQVYGVSGLSFVVGSPDSMGSGYGTILRSIDGGANYAVLNWYVSCTPTANPILGGLGCYSVHFPTTLIGVVGLVDYVIKTTDGGNTWSIMNGGQPLSTVTYFPFAPAQPSLALGTGPITGINILPNQSHIIAICDSMVIETIPGDPGLLVDTWQNNGLTSNNFFPWVTAPLFSGFTQYPLNIANPPLKIGWHLNGFDSPNQNVIYISGDSSLGAHSTSQGSSWVTTPGIGWDSTGLGFGRRSSHFYKWNNTASGISGFYNKDNTVYWNDNGFSPPFEVLSDQPSSGLNYVPTSVWTWYNEVPNPVCYQLVDCANGNIIITSTDLSLYVGQVVTLGGLLGHCFLVQLAQDCAGAVPVTIVTSFVDCITCSPPVPSPCSCPQDTTLTILPDGTKVCREDTITLAEGFDPISGCDMVAAVIGSDPLFPQSTTYNQFGAQVYQDIATRPWPVVPYVDPSCVITNFYFKDNAAALVSVTNNPINTLWGNGSSITSGRHNNSAVWNHFWNPSTCPANPIIGLYGFTHCLTVNQTSTYFFATSGRSFQLKINGLIAVENTSGSNFGTNTLHIFPVTLPAGIYVLEMNGAEVGTGICNSTPANTTGFVWEIYNGVGLTPSTLSAMTTTIQLAAVTIYSTVNESGTTFDYGSVTYNHRCPQSGQALDNCFANPLNPNANPDIYVCHSYADTLVQGCCYILTDCQDPNITYITSTDLSSFAYQNKIITVAEYVGCFTVSEAPNCGPVAQPPVTLVQAFDTCQACLPKCYELTDCNNLVANIITDTDLSAYVGEIINIQGSITCWTVSLAGACQGHIPVVLTASFATCVACEPVCYQLINCKDPNDTKISSTDLSLYLNKVIYIIGCPGVCWQVTLAGTCVGSVPVVFDQEFADCITCDPPSPPIPVELRTRAVKPGYYTPGCDPTYTELINTNFSNAVYDAMTIKRYGINMCCNLPLEPWDIKKQLLNLRAIYDPNLCKNTFEKCCAPCGMFATITVYHPMTCNAPTGMVAVLNVPPSSCQPPTNMQASITLSPNPCVCYLITILVGVPPCKFDYVDCNGVPASIIPFLGPNYICSQIVPTTNCPSSQYVIQSTMGDCLLGTCGAP